MSRAVIGITCLIQVLSSIETFVKYTKCNLMLLPVTKLILSVFHRNYINIFKIRTLKYLKETDGST